jgi:hypothetical protein
MTMYGGMDKDERERIKAAFQADTKRTTRSLAILPRELADRGWP